MISTGSQGEPLSALRRMANNDHRDVELRRGDTVVFSATPVPGNERRAVNENDRPHPRDRCLGRDRQRRPDPRLRPRLPGGAEADAEPDQTALRAAEFHGDHQRLRLHAGLAEAVGIDPERIFQGRNGLPLEIDGSGARFGEDVHAGVVYVDGVNVGEPDDVALRDRREISDDGIFIVVATISSDDGNVVADPEVILRGVAFLEDEDGLVEELKDVVEDAIEDAASAGTREVHLIQEDLHDSIAKLVYEKLRSPADDPAGHRRGLARRRVVNGVVEQVDDHPVQLVGIALDEDRLAVVDVRAGARRSPERPRPRHCRRPRPRSQRRRSPLRPASARASSSRSVTRRLMRCEERRAESIDLAVFRLSGRLQRGLEQLEVGDDARQRVRSSCEASATNARCLRIAVSRSERAASSERSISSRVMASSADLVVGFRRRHVARGVAGVG